ncbi:MAG: LysR family transcriptional regulator [Rhodoferax sp.]
MDLKQLEYFVRVAELGSFTRAANALGVAQPALSRQVRLLEVELRQNLLMRNGRGAVPTEAGQLLLAHGRGILHQVQRAHEELGQIRGSLAGRVAVGLPTSLARGLTVPLTRAFRAALPSASISITEGLSAALLDALLAGRLDLAVLYNAPQHRDIELYPLFCEDLLLVEAASPANTASNGTPVTLREVAARPLVIPSRPNAIRTLVESEMAAAGLRIQVALEIDGVSAILDLVADGAGSAVLLSQAVASAVRPAAYCVRPIVQPQLRNQVCLASSALRPATLTQQKTQVLLRQTLQQAQSGVACAPAYNPL